MMSFFRFIPPAQSLWFNVRPARLITPAACPFRGFEHFSPRSKAAEEIEKRGGKVAGSVSSKTTHLLAGTSPGSKLDKAKKLEVSIINETSFLEMLK